MLNNLNHKQMVKHESVQVIFPYEILKACNADTGKFLWFEVRYIGPVEGKLISPKPFLKESDARDHIISEITHKEIAHK